MGGVLALVSGAALVLFFAVLDEVVRRHYYRYCVTNCTWSLIQMYHVTKMLYFTLTTPG